jgi:hypothetical protein
VEATLQVAPNKALVVTRVKTLNVNISAPRRARCKSDCRFGKPVKRPIFCSRFEIGHMLCRFGEKPSFQ